jgi:antitoxin ParD1/3/4
MTTMNISLPDTLKAFVDAEVDRRGFGSSSEYVRNLIRREQQREALRTLLLDGAASPVDAASNDDYFGALRSRIALHGSK